MTRDLRIRVSAWLFVFAFAGLIPVYVFRCYVAGASRASVIDPEEVRAVLDLEGIPRPQPREVDVVAYGDVRDTFHTFDWVPEPLPVFVGDVDRAKTRSISEVVAVRRSRAHGDAFVWIDYAEASGLRYVRASDRLRQVGDRLLRPYDHARVASIDSEGVTFAFDQADREPERVPWTKAGD